MCLPLSSLKCDYFFKGIQKSRTYSVMRLFITALPTAQILYKMGEWTWTVSSHEWRIKWL